MAQQHTALKLKLKVHKKLREEARLLALNLHTLARSRMCEFRKKHTGRKRAWRLSVSDTVRLLKRFESTEASDESEVPQ